MSGERVGRGGAPPAFFVSVAFKGVSGGVHNLDAMDVGALGCVANGLPGLPARVNFNAPTGPGQAPCTECRGEAGDTPPRVFCAESAEEHETK
jgi:hypothetical protein